jgi:multidrug efflux pump subunit AcrB
MGFVAILGVLALVGILIRNSVILIVQIEEHRRDGMGTWEAVLESTMHRTRPIMLTAAAASLALIPIAREGFWAPMAFAMMGGIVVGTLSRCCSCRHSTSHGSASSLPAEQSKGQLRRGRTSITSSAQK